MTLEDFVKMSLDDVGRGIKTAEGVTLVGTAMKVEFDLVVDTVDNEVVVSVERGSGAIEAPRMRFAVQVDTEKTLGRN